MFHNRTNEAGNCVLPAVGEYCEDALIDKFPLLHVVALFGASGGMVSVVYLVALWLQSWQKRPNKSALYNNMFWRKAGMIFFTGLGQFLIFLHFLSGGSLRFGLSETKGRVSAVFLGFSGIFLFIGRVLLTFNLCEMAFSLKRVKKIYVVISLFAVPYTLGSTCTILYFALYSDIQIQVYIAIVITLFTSGMLVEMSFNLCIIRELIANIETLYSDELPRHPTRSKMDISIILVILSKLRRFRKQEAIPFILMVVHVFISWYLAQNVTEAGFLYLNIFVALLFPTNTIQIFWLFYPGSKTVSMTKNDGVKEMATRV